MGEIRENVQKNLGYYLSVKGISQKELADKLCVSQSAVTNWIKGKNAPDIEVVAQICKILEISVTDLFGACRESLDSSNNISDIHKRVIMQLEKMNDAQARAVLAFMNSLDEVEKNIQGQNEKQ